MALTVGINSYVSVEEASAYFTDRLNASEWFTSTEQSKALVSACDLEDTLCIWEGYKTDENQSLEFPRDGETEAPQDIKDAQCEIALEMIKQGVSTFTESDIGKLEKLKAGSAQLEFYEGFSDPLTVVNNIAKAKLEPYGSCSFGSNSLQVVSLIR